MIKHFHHKPTFGGDLTKGGLNTATITGAVTATVLNRRHDDHFRPASYVGLYGTLTIDRNGNFSYAPNLADNAVLNLTQSATLSDPIKVRSIYNYRGTKGPTITITQTGDLNFPGKVTGLTNGSFTSTTAPLTWTAPASGGAVTDYKIEYKTHASPTWLVFTDSVSATASGTVTGLVTATSYDFRVTALNARGEGTPSDVFTHSTS